MYLYLHSSIIILHWPGLTFCLFFFFTVTKQAAYLPFPQLQKKKQNKTNEEACLLSQDDAAVKKKKGKKEMNFPTKKCNSYTCMLTLEPNLSPSRPHHPAGEILQEGCRQKPL